MEPNVGGRERTARLVAGLVLVIASMAVVAFGSTVGATARGALAAGLLLAGAILLATVGARTCPVNAALGRNSYRR